MLYVVGLWCFEGESDGLLTLCLSPLLSVTDEKG